MKLLVTGAGGQVATELVRYSKGHELHALSARQLDIADAEAVDAAIGHLRPQAVINAAAYAAVDRAELEAGRAYAVNRDGAAHLAVACARYGIPLIHISTDYVFDGAKAGAYVEEDAVAPLGVYGRSKADGEAAVCGLLSTHIILRTSRVFSAHGNNFVKTILRLARGRDELRVVADQIGCPTAASELALSIYALLPQLGDHAWGIYHFCQPDAVSWHGFAEAIVVEGKRYESLRVKHVVPITSAEYATAAKRPANSVLDCGKIARRFGIYPRPWRESLAGVVKELCYDRVKESGKNA